MNIETRVIPEEQQRGENELIGSLNELVVHVRKRGPLFLARLEDAARAVNRYKKALGVEPRHCEIGFEIINIGPDGKIAKNKNDGDDPEAVFTGKSFCQVSSLALIEGLQKRVSDNIELTCCSVDTTTNAENWGATPPRASWGDHYIVGAADRLQEDARPLIYFDPTYAQIDYRYAGQIVDMRDHERSKYYSLPDRIHSFRPNDNYIVSVLNGVKRGGFTREIYESLVLTMFDQEKGRK